MAGSTVFAIVVLLLVVVVGLVVLVLDLGFVVEVAVLNLAF
jgi:hypothetical protein